MDAGWLLGTVVGAAIALIGTGLTAWNARKTAQITAENAARMQSEKLKHDARLGESAVRKGKLEDLCLAVERAKALRYILGHDGVWNTTADDIAEYYIANYYDQVSSWIAEHKSQA